MKIPVFIDCDPGTDDVIALLLAAKIPEIEVVGIGAVCGNVECSTTYNNARKISALVGGNIPVFKGADAPITRELLTAKHVHGDDGLSGLSTYIPDSEAEHEKEKAWDALYRLAKEYKGELVLVAVGPMTNVAIAFSKYKELPSMLKDIVIMGGSAAYGNTTPAAEFNIYVDPEAADILFRCGKTIKMFGLDVTEKSYILPEEAKKIEEFTSPQADFCYKVIENSMNFYLSTGMPGKCLHDPCAVMYIAYPELFKGKPAGVCVETKGSITLGKTVCDLYVDVKFGFENAVVFTEIDREKFIGKIIDIMGTY